MGYNRLIGKSALAGILALFCAGIPHSYAAQMGVSLAGSAELQLNQTLDLAGVLHVPFGTNGTEPGTVTFSVDASALNAGASDIAVSIQAAATTVPASGGDVNFKVHFATLPQSHSFQSLPIQVSAQAGGMTISQSVMVSVDPIYEIDLAGGPIPEGWSSPQSLVMPKHDLGTTIRFVNMDTTDTHTIHGEGAIPHQPIGNPLAEATATQAGGVYEITVPAGDPVMGYYRCHDHETEDMLRSISFNN